MLAWLQTSIPICNCEYLPLTFGVIVGTLSYKIHFDLQGFREKTLAEYSRLWFLWSSTPQQDFFEYLSEEDYQKVGEVFSHKLDQYDQNRSKAFQMFGVCLIFALISLIIPHLLGLVTIYHYYSTLVIEGLAFLSLIVAAIYSYSLYQSKHSIESFINENRNELTELETDLVESMSWVPEEEKRIERQRMIAIIEKNSEVSKFTDFLLGCLIGGAIGFLIAGLVGSVTLSILIGMLSLRNINIYSIGDWI